MICKYSVVIPVYNTTEVLITLSNKLHQVFEEMNESQYEIIFINDCSPNPYTKQYLSEACQQNDKVKVIHFSRNFGQQPATICGIEHAKGDYIITMDDDLQHDPQDIKLLVEQKHHDIVIAGLLDKKHGYFKQLGSRIKNHFDHLILGKPKNIKMSSFRLISRFIADNIEKVKSPNPFIPALLFMISLDVVNVPIKHHERAEGESGYNLKLMLKLFSNLMINNSSFLLNMLGKVGIFTAIGSAIYAVYLIINRLAVGISVEGWTSLMVVVLIMGGLMLFSVGVIGEYLIRVIQSSEQKPSYIVKTIENKNDE
jgi:dolichol-phosphate mannosyltransferase/undecaprenyl-phosphate 4-deoxy-4-formamido-L-arabinose transferase